MVDAAPTPPSPVREKGYAYDRPGQWWDDLTNEQTPELRWPLSVLVFDQMRRQDAQVSSVLRAIKSPILRTQWWVDGTGCKDEVTEFVAANLGLPIKGTDPEQNFSAPLRGRDRFSWTDYLRLSLLKLDYGHQFFEQVYRYDQDTARFRIRKLAQRPSSTISAVNVARDGGLISIEQYGTATGDVGSTLPVSRLVAHVNDREGANWLGQSLLRSAYKNWLLKDHALRKWAMAIDRQASGLPVYTAAEGETDLSAGQDIATGARVGDDAGAAIPHGAELDLKGVEGTLPDIDKFVRYQDEQINRSALGHFLNLGTQVGGQVGSYALGDVLQGTFDTSLETVADTIAEDNSLYLVEDLVDINFGSTEPAPRIVHDQVGAKQSELDMVREAAGLQSDADLVKFLRTVPRTQEAP